MCIHNILYHSTIFKTINDELGQTKVVLNDTVKSLFNGDLFKKKSLLSQSDISALQAYNAELERGVSPMTAYYKTMQNASDAAVNMASSANGATVSISEIPKVSKAAELGLKALSIAGSMLVFFAITEGIKLITKAIDNAITTTEEYKEKLSELKSEASEIESQLSSVDSELKTTQQRMRELESKGTLTFTEKEEYDNLVKQNNELKRSIELLELEQQTKNKEKNKTFVDTMKSDVRSNNEYTSSGDGEIFKGNNVLYSLSGTVYSPETEEAYINQQFDKRRKLLDDKAKAETKEQEDRIQSQIDEIDIYLQGKSEEWRADSEGIDYIQNPTTEDDKAVNEWLDYIADFQDKMAIELGDDSVKINAFNRIVDSAQFDDVVQKLQDLGKQGKVTADMLDDSKYDDFINKLVEIGVIDSKDNLQGIADAFNDVADSADKATDSASEASYSFDSTSFLDSVSEIQSEYDKLISIQKEYNESGAITASTLKDIMDNNLMQYLQFTSDGLSLNTQALENEEQALKDEATAKLYSAMCNDIQNLSLDDTTKLSPIAQTALKNLDATATTAGKNAAIAAQGWWEYGASIQSIPGVSGLTGDNQKKAQAIIKQYQNIARSINSISVGKTATSKSSSASKSAGKTMEDIQKQWKEYLDKYLAMYKAELDAGLIDFNTYLNKSRSLLDEYYRDGKISAKDYWDSIKQLYENQLSVYDKVLSAVTRRIEKEVDGIQDIIDGLEKQNDALQKQLDEYDSVLSVVDDVYEKQIQALEDEKELLQDKIDAINDANDALDLQRRKEEAIYALRRAQEQRNKKLFNGKEFIFTTDQNAVRDAQQTLQDIKTEELINNLEKEQEGIDAEIEKLQEYKEKWQEITSAKETEQNKQLAIALWGQDYERFILQNRISDIENFKNNYVSIQKQIDDNSSLIDSYKEKIEYYQKLKEQWSSISDAYKQSQEDQYAAMVLGAQWESNVLNSRLDTLNKFKNEYIAIQQAITNAAKEAAQAQAAQSVFTSSSSGNTSTGSSNVSQISKPQQTKSFHVVQKVGSGYSTQSRAEQKIDRYNGDGVFWDGSNNKWYVFKNKNYSDTKFSTYDEAIKSDIYKKAGSLRGVAYYASGTNSAKKGLNIVGEAGTETYIDNDGNVSLVTKPTLIPMEGGETVKNAKETQDLLNPDNLVPVEMMEFPGINGKTFKLSTDEFMDKVASVMPNYSSMVQSAIQMPKYDFTPVSRDNSTSVSIGEIHLHEVQNVDGLANAIIRELPSKISQKLGK